LAGGDVFAAEEIDGFDVGDFAMPMARMAATTSEKCVPSARSREKSRSTAGKRGIGFVLARFFCFADGRVQRRKPQLGEENFLTASFS